MARQNDRHYFARAETPAKNPTKIHGPLNLWTTLQSVKDTATGATKTTRAMDVPTGVLINTCTRGTNGTSEALAFVPGAKVMRDAATKLGRLVPTV